MPRVSCWSLRDRVAELRLGGLRGRLAIDPPHEGLAGLAVQGEGLDGRLWAWTVADGAQPPRPRPGAPECVDAYVRGDDLVLTYAATAAAPFETQWYWRGQRAEDGAASDGLAVVVSIRTQLLDTRPIVRLRSGFGAGEGAAMVVDGGPAQSTDGRGSCTVARHAANGGWSLCEACHPADGGALSFEPSGGACWELFGHFLEKGVIRRARLAATVASSGQAAASAAALVGGLINEPLPLST